ncbi:hypothetical protein EDB83DRAFT_2324760 [Lactarius deliciosus]|nr:hypothetical protein EDB83DRAFT_2324760 [Lactarius deliciosus]
MYARTFASCSEQRVRHRRIGGEVQRGALQVRQQRQRQHRADLRGSRKGPVPFPVYTSNHDATAQHSATLLGVKGDTAYQQMRFRLPQQPPPLARRTTTTISNCNRQRAERGDSKTRAVHAEDTRDRHAHRIQTIATHADD